MNNPAQTNAANMAKPGIPSPGLSNTTPMQSPQQPKMVTEIQPGPTAQQTHTAEKPQGQPSMVFTAAGKPHASTGTVHIGYSAKPGQKVVLEKKKLGIPPALYVVGCVVFFILYTVFWLKVFGIHLPYLG
jgi:hypothetical protein